jgi:hypothetical protein
MPDTIAFSIGPWGSVGRRPPKTTWSRAPNFSTVFTIFGGSDHSGFSGSLGSPTGPELKTQSGRSPSCFEFLRRKCLASPRQRFMYTALPSTTASYGETSATSSASRQSTSRPAPCSDSATAAAISAVEPRFDA